MAARVLAVVTKLPVIMIEIKVVFISIIHCILLFIYTPSRGCGSRVDLQSSQRQCPKSLSRLPCVESVAKHGRILIQDGDWFFLNGPSHFQYVKPINRQSDTFVDGYFDGLAVLV